MLLMFTDKEKARVLWFTETTSYVLSVSSNMNLEGNHHTWITSPACWNSPKKQAVFVEKVIWKTCRDLAFFDFFFWGYIKNTIRKIRDLQQNLRSYWNSHARDAFSCITGSSIQTRHV